MPAIEYIGKTEKEHKIKGGDIFHADGEYLILCEHLTTNNFSLINASDMSVVRNDISHVAHAINFVKKDYGEFQIISHEDYKLVIQE